jgi:hypothetical protein
MSVWLKAAVLAAAAVTIITPVTAGASPAVTADISVAPALAAQTALVVGGTSFPTMSQSFMSAFTSTFSTNLVNVGYPAAIAPPFDGSYTLGDSITAGSNSLMELITATYVVGAHIVVWGVSQGALVLNVTQQLLLNDPSAPPASALTFVRVADPAQASTGVLNFTADLVLSKLLHFSMRTAPGESQYSTITITNEYDGFADFPDKWGPLAVLNASAGLFHRHAETAWVDLASVPDRNITTTVNSLGATTTNYLVPATFLPITKPLREVGVPSPVVDALDRFLKPMIDAAYTRNDPPLFTAPSSETAPSETAPSETALLDTKSLNPRGRHYSRTPPTHAAAQRKKTAVSTASAASSRPSNSRIAAVGAR